MFCFFLSENTFWIKKNDSIFLQYLNTLRGTLLNNQKKTKIILGNRYNLQNSLPNLKLLTGIKNIRFFFDFYKC